jgi:hypothetical protein
MNNFGCSEEKQDISFESLYPAINRELRSDSLFEDRIHNDRNVVNTTILLIFPKQFEFDNYIKSLNCLKSQVNHFTHSGLDYNYIMIDVGSFLISYKAIILFDSDIMFSFKMNKIISTFDNEKVKHHYILCGSAGGSTDTYLNQSFRVNRAIKFDRGNLSKINDDFAFTINKKKQQIHKVIPNLTAPDCVTVGCSNHIMNFKTEYLKETCGFDCKIVDMESFEFMAVCEILNIKKYDCLRVVSDKYDENVSLEDSSRLRKRVDFYGVQCRVHGFVFREVHERFIYRNNKDLWNWKFNTSLNYFIFKIKEKAKNNLKQCSSNEIFKDRIDVLMEIDREGVRDLEIYLENIVHSIREVNKNYINY